MIAYNVSASARRDLEKIGDYIALDNPLRAMSFVEEITNQFKLISTTPHIGVERKEYKVKTLRAFYYKEYVIFYKTDGTVPEITRVIHGMRNLDDIALN